MQESQGDVNERKTLSFPIVEQLTHKKAQTRASRETMKTRLETNEIKEREKLEEPANISQRPQASP